MAVSNVGTRMYYPFLSGTTLTQDQSGNGYTLGVVVTGGPIPSGTVDGKYCIGPFPSGSFYAKLGTPLFPETLPNFSVSLDFYAYDVNFNSKPSMLLWIQGVAPLWEGDLYYLNSGLSISTSTTTSNNNSFQLNQWYNLLITNAYQGLTKIYLDNNLIKTVTNNHTSTFPFGGIFLGYANPAWNGFSGCITNVKLYDYIVEPQYTQSNIMGGL